MDNNVYMQQDEAETEKDRKRKLVRDTCYNNNNPTCQQISNDKLANNKKKKEKKKKELQQNLTFQTFIV